MIVLALFAALSATPTTWPAIAASAKPGDIVSLAPGEYPRVDFSGKTYNPPLTVTSADPAHPATMNTFNTYNSDGITFSHLDFKVLLPNYNAQNVYSSKNISFDHVHVYGPPGAPDPDVQVMNFFDSANLSVTDSEIERVSHSLSFARSDHITVLRNNLHNVNSDTLDFTQVGDVLVSQNVLHDFTPTAGNHPDAMQFGTYGTKIASHDVIISDNLVYRGAGANSQGIFISDEVGTLPFANFKVTGNVIVGTGSSALRPTHSAGIAITGNELVTLAGGDPTTLLVQNSDNVSLVGNSAVSISLTAVNGNTNFTMSGNTFTQPVTDGGADAIKRFYARVPTAPGAPVIPPTPVAPQEITLQPGQTLIVHGPPK